MSAPFRIVTLAPELAAEARASRRSPHYGHPTYTEVATGSGPCRVCLDTFRLGEEERLLFTYDPFAGLDAYPSPGPIFVHERACAPYAGDGFPDAVRALPLFLEGYAAGRWLVARERVTGGDVEGAAGRVFAHPAVEYIHVRNAEAGCYVARLERLTA